MRFVFSFALFFAAFATAPAQNCYVRLEDASGINTDAYQTELEAAACALRATFPDSFQNQFKVFDFGFYLHQETYSGGYPEAFAQKIQQVGAISPYYLLFGKQTDATGAYTRFWLELRLPGTLSCLTAARIALIKEALLLKTQDNHNASGSLPTEYAKAEKTGMEYLKSTIQAVKSGNCCTVPPEDIAGIFKSKGYVEYPARFMEKPAGAKNDSIQNRLSGSVNDYANLLCEVIGVEGFEDFGYTLGAEVAGTSMAAFISKDENLCESVAAELLNLSSSGNTFIHMHFSPSQDSLTPGKMFYKEQNAPPIPTIELPTIVIVEKGNCSAGYPLPAGTQTYPYAVAQENGLYYGYNLVNGQWERGNAIEFLDRGPSRDKDNRWGDRGASREYLGFFRYKYFPSYKAWLLSEGPNASENYPSEGLLNRFFIFFYPGVDFLDEKFRIFQQFKYADFNPPNNTNSGTSLNWDCSSTVSKALHTFPQVKAQFENVKNVVMEWLKTHDDLNGLFLNSQIIANQTSNINLSSTPLWAFQAFGGTQGRKIAIRKLLKLYGPCEDPLTTRYSLEIAYTIYDTFGNGTDDAAKTHFPGLIELWVLQHYRNYECSPPCYIPITNHTVEIIDKSIICVKK